MPVQVAQEQLLRARKQLLQAWELHAARMASYRSQLAAEAVLHQTLTVAGRQVVMHPMLCWSVGQLQTTTHHMVGRGCSVHSMFKQDSKRHAHTYITAGAAPYSA